MRHEILQITDTGLREARISGKDSSVKSVNCHLLEKSLSET